jgi:hypothetical protein
MGHNEASNLMKTDRRQLSRIEYLPSIQYAQQIYQDLPQELHGKW